MQVPKILKYKLEQSTIDVANQQLKCEFYMTRSQDFKSISLQDIRYSDLGSNVW